MGNLDAAAAREAGAKFESIVEESFVALLPNRDDFDRAREWLSRFETGLRAGDALHLAIAHNRRAITIYSDDCGGKDAGCANKLRDTPSGL